MLVLSRKEKQRVLVGDDVVITVVRIEGNRVKLGIDAPQSERIVREELISLDTDRPVDSNTGCTSDEAKVFENCSNRKEEPR